MRETTRSCYRSALDGHVAVPWASGLKAGTAAPVSRPARDAGLRRRPGRLGPDRAADRRDAEDRLLHRVQLAVRVGALQRAVDPDDARAGLGPAYDVDGVRT